MVVPRNYTGRDRRITPPPPPRKTRNMDVGPLSKSCCKPPVQSPTAIRAATDERRTLIDTGNQWLKAMVVSGLMSPDHAQTIDFNRLKTRDIQKMITAMTETLDAMSLQPKPHPPAPAHRPPPKPIQWEDPWSEQPAYQRVKTVDSAHHENVYKCVAVAVILVGAAGFALVWPFLLAIHALVAIAFVVNQRVSAARQRNRILASDADEQNNALLHGNHVLGLYGRFPVADLTIPMTHSEAEDEAAW